MRRPVEKFGLRVTQLVFCDNLSLIAATNSWAREARISIELRFFKIECSTEEYGENDRQRICCLSSTLDVKIECT